MLVADSAKMLPVEKDLMALSSCKPGAGTGTGTDTIQGGH